MSELPLSSCENCGGEVKRLITGGTGLIFKGSGFYLTDYKNDQTSADNSSNSTQKKNDKSNPTDQGKNKEILDKSIQKKEKKSDE